MSGAQGELNERMQAAVRLRAKGRTGPEIAEELGVSTSTVQRWFSKEAFKERLRQLMRRMDEAMVTDAGGGNDPAEEARSRLLDQLPEAMNLLLDLMDNTKSEARRLQCIKLMCDIAQLRQDDRQGQVVVEIKADQLQVLEKGRQEVGEVIEASPFKQLPSGADDAESKDSSSAAAVSELGEG